MRFKKHVAIFLTILILVVAGFGFYIWNSKFEIDYSQVKFSGTNVLGEPREKDVSDCIANLSKDYGEMGSAAGPAHINFLCRCVNSNAAGIKGMSDGFAIHAKCRAWTEKYFHQSHLFYSDDAK
jgi:hypothetical protein